MVHFSRNIYRSVAETETGTQIIIMHYGNRDNPNEKNKKEPFYSPYHITINTHLSHLK